MRTHWTKVIRSPRFILFGALFAFAILVLFLSLGVSNRQQVTTYSSRADEIQEAMNLTVNPATVTAEQGEEGTFTIRAASSTGSKKIQGYRFTLVFDKTQMEVLDIVYKLGRPSVGLSDNVETLFQVNNEGSITVQGEIDSQDGSMIAPAGTDVVDIAFRALSTSPSLQMDTNAFANAFLIQDSGELSTMPLTFSSEPRFTVSALPADSEEVSITLKTKFQGIQEKREGETVNVKLTAKSELTPDISALVPLTSEDEGVWTGTASLFLPLDETYTFFVKSSKHVNKQVCDLDPTEAEPGLYTCTAQSEGIQVSETDLELDFSSIVLLVGDVPEQDGVLDSEDITRVRSYIARNDEEALYGGDVNYDGVVDTQDHGLIITSLERTKQNPSPERTVPATGGRDDEEEDAQGGINTTRPSPTGSATDEEESLSPTPSEEGDPLEEGLELFQDTTDAIGDSLGRERNFRRERDVNTYVTGLNMYKVDNDSFPEGLSNQYQQVGTCTSGGSVPCEGALETCVNLGPNMKDYFNTLPTDPLAGENSQKTHYAVKINGDDTVTVTACSAELGEAIEETE